jgi:hypothetical protein
VIQAIRQANSPGFAQDLWCPTRADASDVYGSRSAHKGLCGLSLVCTIMCRCQETRNRARAGATAYVEDDPASVQVGGDAGVAKRSKAAVGER